MTRIQLPAPMPMQMPLVQALGRRRTAREFNPAPLDLPLLSAVLWACAGQNDAQGRRTVPSARDFRSVLAYVFDQRGIWRYHADDNTLELVREGDWRHVTTTHQAFVTNAPVTLMFVADLDRCGENLDPIRERCLAVDAGCMVQSAQLAATAMGLASVARASFDPAVVREAMGLNERHAPQMAVSLGFGA